MPKFLYTVVLLAGVLWFLVGRMFFGSQPDSSGAIVQFLLLLAAAILLTVSIPAYFLLQKSSPNFSNPRATFRRSLKWGFFAGSGISIFLGLRAFGVATPLNMALLGVCYVMIFLQFKGQR